MFVSLLMGSHFAHTLQFLDSSKGYLNQDQQHRCTGRGGGGGGGLQHPQILGNSDFLTNKRNLGKASQFNLKKFPCFFFSEEIDISYFNMKSAW